MLFRAGRDAARKLTTANSPQAPAALDTEGKIFLLSLQRNSSMERTISLVNLSGALLAQVESSPYADLDAKALLSVLVVVRD